jgi:N-acetyl-beta-hexosaminidase
VVLAAGWEIFPQATVGAILSRHGKTLGHVPFFRVEHVLINAFFTLKAYTFDPLANLTTAQASLVLGGQQLLWTEQSGPENLDSIAWPRAAASAEVFWTGAGGNDSAALPRLHEISYRFRRRGVNAISLQPEWCALRPFACNLNA